MHARAARKWRSRLRARAGESCRSAAVASVPSSQRAGAVGGGHLVEQRADFREMPRGARDGGAVRGEALRYFRQDLVPQEIALEVEIGVGFVLDPLEAPRSCAYASISARVTSSKGRRIEG